MAERGGYQPPANPAPVSGPGALSRRTDVQSPMPLPNPAYGEGQQFMDIQSGAPMPMDRRVPPPTGLLAPSERPNEPVTAGNMLGPGPGPEALGNGPEQAIQEMSALGKYMPMMERMATRTDSPRAFRALVQYIKAFNG